MDALQKLVETENVEFVVLVARLQDINARLEKDTTHLKQVKIEEDAKMADKNKDLATLREAHAKKRRASKLLKTDKQVERAEKIKEEENLKIQNCKFSAVLHDLLA